MAMGSTSVGSRIKEARERQQLTQRDLANVLGLSRAAVAQWESDTTSPSIQTIAKTAKLLETSPQWLAFGISVEPEVTYKMPEGSAPLKEVTFGDRPTEMHGSRSWSVPADYLKVELNCQSIDGLIIWRVESPNMEPLYECGDKVIIDLNARKPTPSGTFLMWDGIGPSLNMVAVVPSATGTKPVARVSSTGGGDGYEVPADKLQIVGRVRGLLKNI
jgi:transcriptional regulator with XRE-family HTH domain